MVSVALLSMLTMSVIIAAVERSFSSGDVPDNLFDDIFVPEETTDKGN